VTKSEPCWLGRLVLDEAHFRQIREHGGSYGLRDENALESTLARPRHRWTYEPDTAISELAASFAFTLIQNHPWVDGNKRVALVALVAFLDLNGHVLNATNTEAAATSLAVAAGEMGELELVRWIEAHAYRHR
jgi:death-on-curing protein